MFEEPRYERKYTSQDLEDAKLVVQESEDYLNSFDMSKDDVDILEAFKAKRAWEEARRMYNEVYRKLNP